MPPTGHSAGFFMGDRSDRRIDSGGHLKKFVKNLSHENGSHLIFAMPAT
jgi:hypothetical protein